MAIPSRQIGWSTKANLLWQISKQLERLTCVTAGGCGTTTTTSTIAPTTTTTTTTAEVIINVPNKFVDCNIPCGLEEGCEVPFNYFDVYMTFGCDQTFPTIGCAIWLNIEGTVNFPNGSYNNGNGICITITDGIIVSIM